MAKKTTAKKKSASTKNASTVRVKSISEVISTVQNFLAFNLHGRYNFQLSKQTKNRIVAYGPWLAAVLVIVVLPELLILAKNGNLITFTGFFDTIFFNQQSWVVLLVLLVNIMLFVDGLSHLFNKSKRGWDRIYQATLLTTIYVIWQFFANISQPAAPILSLVILFFTIYTLFEIRKFYK